MADFLQKLAADSARRAARARGREPEATLRRRALDAAAPPRLSLDPAGFDLFAEFKRHSPSAGPLIDPASRPDPLEWLVREYERAGAAAVSVLTEPREFRGSLDDLQRAARRATIPIMRKDFIVDPYQLYETRAAGGAGVLLILRLLDDARLAALLDAADETGLFVLLEAFSAEELVRATEIVRGRRSSGPLLAGLNARDLQTLEVDPTRLRELRSALPAAVPVVAESGLSEDREIAEAAACGFNAALVGTALMRSARPRELATSLIAAGRKEAAKRCVSG